MVPGFKSVLVVHIKFLMESNLVKLKFFLVFSPRKRNSFYVFTALRIYIGKLLCAVRKEKQSGNRQSYIPHLKHSFLEYEIKKLEFIFWVTPKLSITSARLGCCSEVQASFVTPISKNVYQQFYNLSRSVLPKMTWIWTWYYCQVIETIRDVEILIQLWQMGEIWWKKLGQMLLFLKSSHNVWNC